MVDVKIIALQSILKLVSFLLETQADTELQIFANVAASMVEGITDRRQVFLGRPNLLLSFDIKKVSIFPAGCIYGFHIISGTGISIKG
jgi:hypothetical protein